MKFKVLSAAVAALLSPYTFAETTDIDLPAMVVNADFRPSLAQETPISLTTFDSELIESRGAQHVEDILNLAPNVNASSGASRGQYFQIRGMGARSQFTAPLNPSVGLVIDGIDFSRTGGAATLFDIEQVEILRGPQGTRFGTNSLAGVINMKSKQPTDELNIHLETGIAEYNTRNLGIAVGGPLIENKLLGRASVYTNKSDGYMDNHFLNTDDTQNHDEITARGHLKWLVNNDLAIDLNLLHLNIDNGYDAFTFDNSRNSLTDKPGEDSIHTNAFSLNSDWRINDIIQLQSSITYAKSDVVYGYDADWVYSDNDKLDSSDLRCCWHAKPAWSPELLLTYNYILHLSVIRRSLIEQAGGFRTGFEGSQDHDLYLRLAELSSNIRHIPRILYSWRQSADSVALNPENIGYAYEAALRALNSALERRGEQGLASHPKHSWLGSYQIIRSIGKPKIDVIFLSTPSNALRTSHSLTGQKGVTLTSQLFISPNKKAGDTLYELINCCQSGYILLLSPLVQFTGSNQLLILCNNLVPSGVALSTAKISHQNNQVDHCGLAYQHGLYCYPLRDWPTGLDGMGAYGALPRNISINSPLINLVKAKEIRPYLEKLKHYASVSAWLVALALELKAHQQRLVADGGISILYLPMEPYQLTLPEQDKLLLAQNYPDFFMTNDLLYHQQMN